MHCGEWRRIRGGAAEVRALWGGSEIKSITWVGWLHMYCVEDGA